jgi:uncharacterized cofD-like protein
MARRSLRFVRWFYPGLGVKRWLIVAVLGGVVFADGASRWLTAEGMHLQLNELLDSWVDDFFDPSWLTWILLVVGLLMIVFGMRQWLQSIVDAIRPQGKYRIVDALLDMRLRRGYKIVAIGGGTGLSTLLRGLKRFTSNLTAVVTVSDDGGSSGRLQKELGVLPPGDVRNCLVALADDEALVTDLFQYRFPEGEGLSGHSFGNLFLAAMTGITGNFDRAVQESSRVLNIKGRVLPATLAHVQLCAVLADGSAVEGESKISRSSVPIDRIMFDPPYAAPLADVISAIDEADAIILGPGSLYTSILPNFLVEGIARRVGRSSAVKIYICNVMTQPGETTDYTASDHVRALLRMTREHVCDYVVVNEELPQRLLDAYAEQGQVPVKVDGAALAELGVRIVRAKVISETQTVRHDPRKLASVVVDIVNDAIRERASYVKPAEVPAAVSASPSSGR